MLLTVFSAQAQDAAPRPLQELLAARQRAMSEPLPPEREALRQTHLAAAREALLAGEPNAASARLEEAAGMSHAADTEVLQLHAQLQRGEFREALAFAAHTAGAHLGSADALGLYVWLLALCEQPAPARSLLDAALQREPGNARALALRADLDTWLDDRAALRSEPPRPMASGPQPSAHARLLAGGMLLPDAQTALVPAAALGDRQQLWLRNGLGQTRPASPTATSAALQAQGLVLLRLQAPMSSAAPPLRRAARDAFAGSPAAALAPPRRADAAAAWPVLHSGFVGRVGMRGQALGIALPRALPGGPVLDSAGRLIGLSMTGNGLQLLPLSALMAGGDAPLQALAVAESGTGLLPDQLYELALPYSLQVLGE